MVFYGASGHAKVVIEAHIAAGGQVTGIFDDNTEIRRLLSYPVSGKYDSKKFPSSLYLVSIGDNRVRRKIVSALSEQFGKVVHPAAVASTTAIIGPGSVVMAGVIINAESRIGAHVILNTGAVVDHDSVIDSFVHISPNATVCGGVHVGEGAHIGAGATVIPNIRVGKWATIGAGAVVIADVPDYAVVVGVPGQVRKYNHANP